MSTEPTFIQRLLTVLKVYQQTDFIYGVYPTNINMNSKSHDKLPEP